MSLIFFSFLFWRDWVGSAKTAENFSSLFCFFIFFFFFFFIFYTTRRIVVKSDKKIKASWVFVPEWTGTNISRHRFFSLFLFFMASQGLFRKDSWIFLVTILFLFFLFFFLCFFSETEAVQKRRLNISRHYIVFLFLFLLSLTYILRAG